MISWLSLNINLAINIDFVNIFENQFKLVLKLSLKDQILIKFTKPNSYFSYVSEHDLELDFFVLRLDDFNLQQLVDFVFA